MPAVDRIRLQTQIRLVKQSFASAEDFAKRLADLYEFYSDRSFAAPGSAPSRLNQVAYNVTPLVTREFEYEFSKLCIENPLSSLDVIDQLWQQPKLEPRKLAAYMLGKMPLEFSDQIIRRVQKWSIPTEDRELIQYLQTSATDGLRRHATDLWLNQISLWLDSRQAHEQIFGLQSLIPLIEEDSFHNLPRIFSLIHPLIVEPNARIQYMLQTVIEALAKRTPVETVYNLKLILQGKYSKEVPRLFRRILDVFPEEQAMSLRQALRDAQNDNPG